MHDWPHLSPHCLFHWLLRLVMLMGWRSAIRGSFCLRTRRGHGGWIWYRAVYRIGVGIALLMLSGCAAQSNVTNARYEIAGFLFYSFALMFLWSSCGTVMATKDPG